VIRALITRKKVAAEISEALEQYRKRKKWLFPNSLLKDIHREMELPQTVSIDQLNSPAVLFLILDEILTEPSFDHNEYEELSKKYFRDKYNTKDNDLFVRIRLFDPQNAIYYGKSFLAASDRYFLWDDTPLIIVTNNGKWLKEGHFIGNEVGWITRAEVRLLTSLAFGSKTGYRVFQLGATIDCPSSYFLYDIFSKGNDDKLIQDLRFLRRLFHGKKDYGYSFGANFTFAQETQEDYAGSIYDTFDINNRLVLRTSLHFLKAGMLFYRGNTFSEEAFMNMYFGIEGTLRLIHHMHYGSLEFNITRAKKAVNDVFPNQYFSEALEEFYQERVALVHPEPDFESDWVLWAMADDFLDNYEWVRCLLIYAITKKVIAD
jgi:hypothetical protein